MVVDECETKDIDKRDRKKKLSLKMMADSFFINVV